MAEDERKRVILKFSIFWFTFQMPTISRSGLKARSQELHVELPHGGQGPKHFGCFSRIISREHDMEWSSWVLTSILMCNADTKHQVNCATMIAPLVVL